jgi:hypothetical protein
MAGPGLIDFNAFILGGVEGGNFATNGISSAPAVVGDPMAGYGTIGQNDSGWWAVEAKSFTRWMFKLEQFGATTLTGIAVTIYAAISPNVLQTYRNALLGPRTQSGPWPPPMSGQNEGQSLYGGPGAGVVVKPYGMSNATGFVPGIQPWDGFILDAPSQQSGTGQVANPMTPQAPILVSSWPLIAVRAVVTSDLTAGAFGVSVLATP